MVGLMSVRSSSRHLIFTNELYKYFFFIRTMRKYRHFILLYLAYVLVAVDSFNLDIFYPLIYQDFSGQARDNVGGSYFGMSVAIRPRASELDKTWFIQIGAPRGNLKQRPDVDKPGAVYRCQLHGPCHQIPLDNNLGGSGGEGLHAYKGKEDNAWIGSSMDIKRMGHFERTVVCGHRWINQNLKNSENIDVTYLMTGVCYLQDLFNETHESEISKFLPLVNSDKIYAPRPYVVNFSTYFWGLGQAGTSVLLTEKPPNLLIGAPGVTHWIGSVIRSYGQHLSVGDFLRTETSRNNRYTYLGYAIAAGRFFKDKKLWFAAGAPRSANYRGEVLVFQYKAPTNQIQVQTVLKGTSLGEYFGSVLMAEDLNGDGFDDLVVGAPTYSKRHPDEGRIYVYLGSGKGNFLVQSQVVNGNVKRGRFGSCIASLKDLDQDGFNDVVVGAPYENERKGAIYVYRGFPLGLETIYSQRIVAESIDPYLRGFGMSISGHADVDGNKYNDVAVGAYLTDQVVLLRSRPIILLHPQVKTEGSSLIDRQATSVNISVCARYTGTNPPEYIDVIRTMDIDPVHGRAVISDFANRKIIHLRMNEMSCETYVISLQNSGKNYSPIQVILRNELPSCSKGNGGPLLIGKYRTGEKDNFSKWCPIGRKSEVSKEISFAGICGTDAICLSDVQLSCVVPEFLNGSYVIGHSKYFRLHVGLINSAEPAFNTKLKIWSNTKLIWRDSDSDDASKSPQKVFWQNIDGVFSERFQTEFSFEIPLHELSELKSELIVMAEVFTSNPDTNLDNNKCRISTKLISDASVSLYSSSFPNRFFMSRKTIDNHLNVTHYYEVEKTGTTPLVEAELFLYIPSYGEVEFMSYDVETSDWAHLVQDYQTGLQTEDSDLILNTDTTKPSNCSSEKKTLFLNCSASQNDCRILKIIFPTGIPSGPSSYVKMAITLNTSVFGDSEVVCFATSAVLRFKTYEFFNGSGKQVHGSALLKLVSEEKEKTVEGYVVALSVLSGGFILFLLSSWLARKNFFKRTKRDELKTLKDAENCFVYFSTGECPTEPKAREVN